MSKDYSDDLPMYFPPKTKGFSSLPNWLIAGGLISAEGLGVTLYLESKPDSWIPRPSDIKRVFRFKRSAWLRVSEELKRLGILSETFTRHGRRLDYVFDWQAAIQPQSTADLRIQAQVAPQLAQNNEKNMNEINHESKNDTCASAGIRNMQKTTHIVNKDLDHDHEININPIMRSAAEPAEHFDIFWNSYDLKMGKIESQRAFKKAQKDPSWNFKKVIERAEHEAAYYSYAKKLNIPKNMITSRKWAQGWLTDMRWNDTEALLLSDLDAIATRVAGKSKNTNTGQNKGYVGDVLQPSADTHVWREINSVYDSLLPEDQKALQMEKLARDLTDKTKRSIVMERVTHLRAIG